MFDFKQLYPNELNPASAISSSMYAVSYDTRELVKFDMTNPITLKSGNHGQFRLWHSSPILLGAALLGELDKAIPMSEQRFGDII